MGRRGAWRKFVLPSDSGAPIEVRPSVPRVQRGGASCLRAQVWPSRWNPISSDARAASPGSAALPKRPGRRHQRGEAVRPSRLEAAWRRGVLPSGGRPGLDVAQAQDDACRDRPCPRASFQSDAAAGGLVRLEGLKPAALTSVPEGRRWIWPSRGRCCTHRGPLAGGTNEDAHAPTTTPSPAGRSASSSEAPAFSARPVCV